MIALGLMLFDGRKAPRYSTEGLLPFAMLNPEAGLTWVERGMKMRCSYAQPVFAPRSSPDRPCLVYESPAALIWPSFRFGRDRNPADGGQVVIARDPARERYWRQKDIECRASAEVAATSKTCQF